MDPQLPQLSPNQWYMEGRGSGESGLGRCNIYVCIYIYIFIFIYIYIYMCTCFWCISYVFASMPMTREVCSLPQTRASRSPTRTARSALKKRESSEKPITVGGPQALSKSQTKGGNSSKKRRPYKPYNSVHIYIYHYYIIYLIFRKILRHVRTACVYIYF